jgi:excisionase family DNA binding protein
MEKELYSVEEFANLLGVSRHAIYKWVRQREVASYKVGRELRFSKACIANFLSKRFRSVA